MSQTDRKRIYGVEPWIAIVALSVATVDAVIIPLSFVPDLIADPMLQHLAIASAGVATLLFLRLLFSPRFHYALGQANKAMSGGQMFQWKWNPLKSAEWGLMGSKMGTGYIVPLRLTLVVEFLVVVAIGQDDQWRALLAFSGCALAMMLTQSQLTNHFKRPGEGALDQSDHPSQPFP